MIKVIFEGETEFELPKGNVCCGMTYLLREVRVKKLEGKFFLAQNRKNLLIEFVGFKRECYNIFWTVFVDNFRVVNKVMLVLKVKIKHKGIETVA